MNSTQPSRPWRPRAARLPAMRAPGPPGAQAALIRRLADALGRDCGPVQLLETPSSWIIVSAGRVYKFKKAVRLDFLDYSTLAARRFYCQEALRLNRRLAPSLYLGVVAVTGSASRPAIGGEGAALEYAVCMRAVPRQALWSARSAARQLGGSEVDALADTMARFHADAPVAPDGSAWGAPAAVLRAGADDLAQLADLAPDESSARQILAVHRWRAGQPSLAALLARRRADGRVRECHGDLHCGNILTLDGQVEVFDGIAFNEAFRWIDVIDDLGCAYMDLQVRGEAVLAARLLNRYLERSGDYAALAALRYYRVMRAVVRCKVAWLGVRQAEGAGGRSPADGAAALNGPAASGAAVAGRPPDGGDYLAYASGALRPSAVALIITRGYSGSGKSFLGRLLAEALSAIQLRSEVERKRLCGMASGAAMPAPPEQGIYGARGSPVTYARLLVLARAVLEAGWPVVVDASFLRQAQRRQFQALARDLGAPFLIVDLHASAATLKARILFRAAQAGDASDAGLEVLAQQIVRHDPLSADEQAHALPVDATRELGAQAVRQLAAAVRASLAH